MRYLEEEVIMALSKKPGIYAFVCTDHDDIPTHFQGAELGVKGRHTRGVRTTVAKQFDRSTKTDMATSIQAIYDNFFEYCRISAMMARVLLQSHWSAYQQGQQFQEIYARIL